jgi:hypothetical protein
MRKLACIAAVLAVLAHERASRAEGVDMPVVVWVAAAGAGEDAVFPIAAAWVEELRIAVVREEVATPLDDAGAQRALLSHGAIAVVWHGASGSLRILFSGETRSERVAVAAGGITEEGLYLRELIAARLAVGSDLGAALVTVPDEVVAMRGRYPDVPAVALEAAAQPVLAKRTAWAAKIGGGYFASAHFDAVLWWQQGIRFDLPALRFDDLVQAQLELELGLPSSVGAADGASLELRTVTASLGAGLFLLRGSVVEMELSLATGPHDTDAVAFLPTGESADSHLVSWHATASAGLVVHPAPRMDIRFRFDVRYVIRPPSIAIAGEGDFGAHPWQPGGGIDLAFALFSR